MSEPIVAALCRIPANPDISGVGVRTAIYVQNFLSFILAIWALLDGNVTREELEYAEMQTTTNLVLAFAILISSIVQACTLGMSNYHGNIVLMMSWMNNTNAFVYFILYVHHKTGLPQGQGRVDPNWAAWARHVKERLSQAFSLNGSILHAGDVESNSITKDDAQVDAASKGRANALIKRFALVLGSFHFTFMSALGIWFWSDLRVFGIGQREPATFAVANKCAVDSAVIALLGQDVPLQSASLRSFSLFIYSLFLVPGVNLVIPMALFLAIYLLCRKLPLGRQWEVFSAYLGLDILLAINIVFIIDIESTLNLNVAPGLQERDERDWGFGQILAILLLLLPLRDLVEAMLSRRVKRRQGELDEDLCEAIAKNDFNDLRRAIERGTQFPSPKSLDVHLKFWTIVAERDALQYFRDLRRARMTLDEKALENDLHEAIHSQNYAGIDALYRQGADLIAGVVHSEEFTSVAFWYAIDRGHTHVARFHAQFARRVNETWAHGQTALIMASAQGNEVLTKCLLKNTFLDVNMADDDGCTALMHASQSGHTAIVASLLERGDIDVNAASHGGETALTTASYYGHQEIVERLLERDDIQVKTADIYADTASMSSSWNGHSRIVEMLLKRSSMDVESKSRLKNTTHGITGGKRRNSIRDMIKRHTRCISV